MSYKALPIQLAAGTAATRTHQRAPKYTTRLHDSRGDHLLDGGCVSAHSESNPKSACAFPATSSAALDFGARRPRTRPRPAGRSAHALSQRCGRSDPARGTAAIDDVRPHRSTPESRPNRPLTGVLEAGTIQYVTFLVNGRLLACPLSVNLTLPLTENDIASRSVLPA